MTSDILRENLFQTIFNVVYVAHNDGAAKAAGTEGWMAMEAVD